VLSLEASLIMPHPSVASPPPVLRPMNPVIYEVFTRQWLAQLSAQHDRAITLATVPDEELQRLVALGVTHLWLMGVWPTGPLARQQALSHPQLHREYDQALPGWTDADVRGSPYAIAAYTIDEALGGDAGLAALRDRLRAVRVGVVLDFIPNHLGLDHDWARRHPERFVAADAAPLGEPPAIAGFAVDTEHRLAHGKDPYFPAWTDTLQLDYRRADTQRAMAEQLLAIAERCDGVRCDMAMLVLNEIFARTWSAAPLPVDVERASGEFWAAASAAVHAAHPGFLLIAEAYWDLEHRLCALGFDFAYDKKLYDRVVHDQLWQVQAHVLGLGSEGSRRVHFIENHDEPRAAAVLPPALHRAAAALILALPGAVLLHDGQLDGLRRFARVQLGRRAEEPHDEAVRHSYAELLAAFADSAVGRGAAALLTPRSAWHGNGSCAAFVIVQWQRADDPAAFDLAVINLAAERAQCRVALTAAGLAGGTWQLRDRLGQERWQRDGDELAGAGLFLDVAGHTAQLFAFSR
jgi:Alpha amylase, catalytic domain